MGVVVPNGKVKLCAVPIDNTYKNQLTFTTAAAQTSYFASLSLHNFDDTDYTFLQKDSLVRIAKNADVLYNINYIMYQNTAFSSKWFYGFVTKIEWLSDGSSAVYFETDVWNTWQFNISLKDSFIVREHSATLTERTLQPENLELGEYVETASQTAGLGDMAIIVSTTVASVSVDGELTNSIGNLYGGVYSGAQMMAYNANRAGAVQNLNLFLSKLTSVAAQDAVISIYMVPSIMLLTPPIGDTGEWIDPTYNSKKITKTVSFPPGNDGYLPTNSKLSDYPYKFIYVHNNNGSGAVYHFERFQGGVATFEITGSILPNPTFKIVPKNYKQIAGRSEGDLNYDEGITLSGFPMCQWTYDSFKAWLAQNGASTAIATLGGVAALGAGIATGNAIAIGGGALGIASTLAKVKEADRQPPQARGNAMSGGANASIKTNDFFITVKTITAEYTKVIDEYFKMFGYKTNRLKTPNIKSRTRYNYIQTIDANITGGIPVNDLSKIKKMFDDGVTFWHDKSNILNYVNANTPV